MIGINRTQRVYSVHGHAPHIRHIAQINKIVYPAGAFSTGAAVITGEIAVTVCGRILRDVWDGENISTHYTDGSTYLIDCPTCAKRRAEAVKRFGDHLVPMVPA